MPEQVTDQDKEMALAIVHGVKFAYYCGHCFETFCSETEQTACPQCDTAEKFSRDVSAEQTIFAQLFADARVKAAPERADAVLKARRVAYEPKRRNWLEK